MSALSQIAKDPSCLLAVDALQGGRWLSPLRPGTQRNFAVAIKTWDVNTDPAVLALLDGIEDWQFEMVCHGIEAGKSIWRSSVTETANCFLMLFSDSTSIWARIYDRSELVISSKRVALLADVTADSRIKVTARREGTTYTLTATVDGVQTLNVTQDHTLTATAGTYATPRTATGYVDSIRITNLTMQEVVWQAAYSDLYDTSKPWPSDVPRNFAEEEKSFYDYQAILSEQLDPTHDYSFFMDTEIVSDKSDCPMFYIGGADGVFGLYCYSNNTIRFTTNLLRSATNPNDKYASMLVYRGDARPAGRHSFEGRIEGNIIKTFFDNQPAFTSAVAARTNTKTVGCNRCNSGYVYKIQIEDLTTGKTVWSYPTWEERTRLLTKTNVRTDRGVFEAADDTKVAGIATPLDFRGNTTSKTFIVRAFCPSHDPASKKLYINPFFVQGSIQEGASFYTFQFSIWEDHRSGMPTRLFPAIGSGTNSLGPIVNGAEIYLDQWHTYAMVIDYNGGNCYIRVFVDGVLLQEKTVSGTPVWNTPAATTTQETTVGIRRDPNSSNYAGSLTRVSAALIFDRALSAAEIAALSYAVV